MKRIIKSLVIVAFVFAMSAPAWGQASTQGREFWVSLIPSRGPDGDNPNNKSQFMPYIAISAPKACKVTVSNLNKNWSKEYTITQDNSWLEITDIPLEQWYTTSSGVPAAGKYQLGLKVETTEEVSVYCSLRWSKSMDATNVLPVTALESTYSVQTYPPSAKDGVHKNTFAVLAAEDCTVDVTPVSGSTAISGGSYSLKAGEVQWFISNEGTDVSGTTVEARDGKKVAVFAGCILGNVPTTVADRDLLYEQLFPIDFWGTDFVVTRSLEKDANRVQLVALNNGTEVSIYGSYQATSTSADIITGEPYTFSLNAGEKYEFELSSGYENGKWDTNKRATLSGINVVGNSAYIKTSCPCAVLSYDVGNSYVCKTGSEEVGSAGAPAMTWVSPIQQMMKDVVFGVMGTDQTKTHFVNIIVPSDYASSVSMNGNSLASSFTAVESNSKYSYARVKLEATSTGKPNPTYHLHCEGGFIATVYGNGSDESYAYSVGSSAVKQGVMVGGLLFAAYEKNPDKYLCINQGPLEFNASVGLDEVTRADWNFGDGTKMANAGTTVRHEYSSPGWYDVTVHRYGHQVCTDVDEQDLGSVMFSIRVIQPFIKYVLPKHPDCKDPGEPLPPDGPEEVDLTQCLDTILVPYHVYGYNSYDTVDRGSFQDSVMIYGSWKRSSGDTTVTLQNAAGCDSILTVKWKIIASLDFRVDTLEGIACDSAEVELPFIYTKGDIGESWLIDKTHDNKKIEVDRSYLPSEVPDTKKGTFTLPTGTFRPGVYELELHVKDDLAKEYGFSPEEYVYPIRLTVLYSEHIFKRKFNNVLAVYKSGRGGNAGYSFTGYQWYYRDSQNNETPIFGATESVYHSEGPLATGWYSVDLTDKNAFTLRSCEQYIDESALPDYEAEKNAAPQKVLENQRIYIKLDDKIYDIYGQRVQ